MADAELNALASASTPLDTVNDLVYIEQGGIGKKMTVGDFRQVDITKVVTAAQTVTTTAGSAITDFTTSLTPGTYLIKAWVVLQSTATGTGPALFVNASGGTVTTCSFTWYSLTTGTTATTGVMDQASAAATFQTMEGRAQRANNTNGGAFGGTDTANADQFAVMEGILVVTATTSFTLVLASETAGTGVSVRPGSTCEFKKVA